MWRWFYVLCLVSLVGCSAPVERSLRDAEQTTEETEAYKALVGETLKEILFEENHRVVFVFESGRRVRIAMSDPKFSYLYVEMWINPYGDPVMDTK